MHLVSLFKCTITSKGQRSGLIVFCYFKPVAGSWKPVRHKIYLVWPYLRQKELDTLIHLYEEYEEYEVR